MRITFALICCVALFLGVLFILESKSAIHQILAAITLLTFVVSAATVAILGALAKLQSPTRAFAPFPDSADSTPAPNIFPEPASKPAAGRWVKSGQ